MKSENPERLVVTLVVAFGRHSILIANLAKLNENPDFHALMAHVAAGRGFDTFLNRSSHSSHCQPVPPSTHRRKRQQNRRKPAETVKPRDRNSAMDGLRGLAIVMMVIDHALGLIGGWGINESSIRIAMRLSMPLFALLMGYFWRPEGSQVSVPEERGDRRWTEMFAQSRLAQIALAAVLVNLVFYPAYRCLDILASFFLVAMIARLSGRLMVAAFPWFFWVAFAYPFDPTDGWPNGGWMDFPLTIVLGFAALGSLYSKYGRTWGLVAAGGMTAFYPLAAMMTPGSVSPLLFLFVLPAMGMLVLAERFPHAKIPGLETLGRHPLKAYVIQYYIIFGIAHCLETV